MVRTKDITVAKYEEGDFLIYIVEKEEEFEAWIGHRRYGVISLIVGINKTLGDSTKLTWEKFEEIVEDELPDAIELYTAQYFDDDGECGISDDGEDGNDVCLFPEIRSDDTDSAKSGGSVFDGKIVYNSRPDGNGEKGIYLIDAPEEKDGKVPEWRDAMYIGHNEQGWWYWMFGVRTRDMLTEDIFLEKLPEYENVGCSEGYFDTVKELLGNGGYTKSDLKFIEHAVLGS